MTLISSKISQLPPYLFSKIHHQKEALLAQGVDVIDLGIGAPDLPTPSFIIERLMEEVQHSANHRYAPYEGIKEFKQAVASFYKQHYGVDLDPETEVLTLIGSKEGIANFIQASINPGDKVIIPDPGYPVYRTAVHLAGGIIVDLPLDENNGFVPRFDQLSNLDKHESKLMFLNYPGNPTAATVELNTFLETITFAEKHDILVANDMAYDLVTFGAYQAPSILQVPGAKRYAVEFGSLSKSFNMTGWRIGYVVGNSEVIHALATLKSNIDSSQFIPIQKAAATALQSDLAVVMENNRIFEERMEYLHHGLQEIGIEVAKPQGTIFLWAKVPAGFTSMSFAEKLLQEAGVIVTPGVAFGKNGEGYFRIALSVTMKRLHEVIERLKQMDWEGGN